MRRNGMLVRWIGVDVSLHGDTLGRTLAPS